MRNWILTPVIGSCTNKAEPVGEPVSVSKSEQRLTPDDSVAHGLPAPKGFGVA